MTEAMPETVSCRLCTDLVPRDAAVCPSCGAKAPWIPDEPTIRPRVIWLAMWGGGLVLIGLLLFVAGVLMFAPAEEERDHRPAATAPSPDDSR